MVPCDLRDGEGIIHQVHHLSEYHTDTRPRPIWSLCVQICSTNLNDTSNRNLLNGYLRQTKKIGSSGIHTPKRLIRAVCAPINDVTHFFAFSLCFPAFASIRISNLSHLGSSAASQRAETVSLVYRGPATATKKDETRIEVSHNDAMHGETFRECYCRVEAIRIHGPCCLSGTRR
jgi:hypothetical protein